MCLRVKVAEIVVTTGSSLPECDKSDSTGKVYTPTLSYLEDISSGDTQTSCKSGVTVVPYCHIVAGENGPQTYIFPGERTTAEPPAELRLESNQF